MNPSYPNHLFKTITFIIDGNHYVHKTARLLTSFSCTNTLTKRHVLAHRWSCALRNDLVLEAVLLATVVGMSMAAGEICLSF